MVRAVPALRGQNRPGIVSLLLPQLGQHWWGSSPACASGVLEKEEAPKLSIFKGGFDEFAAECMQLAKARMLQYRRRPFLLKHR